MSYQGVGFRAPHDSCLPSCFWASQRGGELAQAPGAAEVGAQGMGGGTGLGEEGRARRSAVLGEGQPQSLTECLLRARNRDTRGLREPGPCPHGALSLEEEHKL